MLLWFYIIINILTFLIWGFDKWRAQNHQWRISEKMLFTFILLGGAFGAIMGMQAFHHKTRKTQFWVIAIIGCIIHLVILLKYA